MKYKYCLLIIMAAIFICSCANYKSVAYFQNAEQFEGTKDIGYGDLRIKPKDKLSIFLFSGDGESVVAPFNLWDPTVLNLQTKRVSTGGVHIHYYIVDNDGNIDFPIIGSVRVGGLTLDSVNSQIKKLVLPYLQPGTDCVVNTYIENFEITVLGEVENPNTFTITRPQINVLEALAMAGDMTIYGRRDNLKILREQSDGTYEVHELDMRDTNILNSPYYYLQQRDVVYVEPNEVMAQNAKIGITKRLWIRGAAITISLGSLLYRVLQ